MAKPEATRKGGGAFIQGHVDTGGVDGNGGGDSEELAKEFLGLSALIFTPGLGGQEAVERTGPAGQAGGVNLGRPGRHQAQVGSMSDLRTVGGQVGALGNDVQAGKGRQPWIEHRIHDVALALLADALEGQETAAGVFGWNQFGTWEFGLPGDGSQVRGGATARKRRVPPSGYGRIGGTDPESGPRPRRPARA